MDIALCSLAPMENKDGSYVPLKNTFAYRSSCPYNIYLLAAIMEQAGYKVSIKDWNGKKCGIQEIFEELLPFDVIMISSNSWNWHPSARVIEKLRSKKEGQIIAVGGLQATLFGRKIIEEYPVDYIIRGEGEKSLIPLLKLIEKKGSEADVPGLIYKKGEEIYINPVSPLMTREEMSSLPVPLYERLPAGVYNWLSIESSRGCTNHCTYCSVPYQRSWRPLDPLAFVNRIEAYIPCLDRVLTGKFLFIDDSFIIDVHRAREIAGLLGKRKLKIQAIWNGHVKELFEKEMLRELSPYTDAILVGAESFHEETLKRVGKNFKPEDILDGTKIAVKLGIAKKLLFSFIIGFPWQNKEIIMEQIEHIYDLVSESGASAIINWLILNPGSRIWNDFYGKKKVSLRNTGELYDDWKKNIFPLDVGEVEEVNCYILYLQNTLPGGAYRFQQHSHMYDKIT